MDDRIIGQSKEFVTRYFEEQVGEQYTYHNIEHTMDVVESAAQLAEAAHLDADRKEILLLAALFHDTGFGEDPENHEAHSASIARNFLAEHDYPEEKIAMVEECILATKMDWTGDDKLCCLIRDADLGGLGKTKYTALAERLRQEMNARDEQYDLGKAEWLQQNIKFLKEHDYLTEEGQKLFGSKKEQNLNMLLATSNGGDQENNEKHKEKKKKKKLSIGNSKSAQTQLKTALRNHIDLSAIADNKANIMLSVNAIVITVGIPLLVEHSYQVSSMVIPTIILAGASLLSMIFATLSTRPAKMSGATSPDMITDKKSNLFFFGNYFKMDFEDYEKGMQQVVGDNSKLDNAITRDLFYLGKSLGKKYEYLRWCYNIFMYGVALAVLSFGIIVLI